MRRRTKSTTKKPDKYRVEGKINLKTSGPVTKTEASRIAKKVRSMGGTAKITKAR